MPALGYTTLSAQQQTAVKQALQQHNHTGKSVEALSTVLSDVHSALNGILPPGMHAGQDAQENVDWFQKWAGAYAQNSRFFHNLNHLREMTHTPREPYEALSETLDLRASEMLRLQRLNVLAGFYHDVEYVQVDGQLTRHGDAMLANHYVEQDGNAWKVKNTFDGEPHKEAVEMVLAVFGKNKGETLSPFAGMNELLSAMEAAIELDEKGVSKKDILHVVASIEATVPFGPEDRLNRLRECVGNAGVELSDREADMIAGNAALLANQDIITLTGGLRPGEKLCAENIRSVLKGTDELHQEEVPALRTSIPGDYPANELAKALLKQHTLFNFMLKDGSEKQVFHSVDFSSGKSFPPKEEVNAYEEVVKTQIAPALGLLLRARLAAVRLVAGLAEERGWDNRPMREVMDLELPNVEKAIGEPKTHGSELEQLVFDVLYNERQVGANDMPRSLTAAYLLQTLGKEGIEALVPVVDLQFNHPVRQAVNGGRHGEFMEEIDKRVKEGKMQDPAPMLLSARDPFRHSIDDAAHAGGSLNGMLSEVIVSAGAVPQAAKKEATKRAAQAGG